MDLKSTSSQKMSEKFSLHWNDFQQTVTNSFRSLRKETDFFDVTLVSDDEIHMTGHKLVLSACSDFFKSILKKSTSSHPMIYLSGISSRNLEFIMDYIYKGEVQIYQEQLDDFLEIAQKLKIAGLINTNPSDEKVKTEINSPTEDLQEMMTINTPKEQKKNQYKTQNLSNFVVEESSYPVEKSKLPSIDTTDLDLKIKEMIMENNGLFVCSVCGKSASTRQNLGKHIETHIDGLSFSCQYCNKSFRSRNSLQRHESQQHKLKF